VFWQLLRESVIAQAFITVSFALAFIVLVIRGQAIPEVFQNLLLIIVGYWFGTYTQKGASALARGIETICGKDGE
jgi:galactitol-specific phosphotransferase system IIC component